jgi:hypothetical protein
MGDVYPHIITNRMSCEIITAYNLKMVELKRTYREPGWLSSFAWGLKLTSSEQDLLLEVKLKARDH